MRQAFLSTVLLFFLLNINVIAAELNLMGSREISMPWAHRNGSGMILEMIDSSHIISRNQTQADFSILTTTREQDSQIKIVLQLMIPGEIKPVVVLNLDSIKLKRNITLAQTLQVKFTSADIEKIAAVPSRYNLQIVKVNAVFIGADGKTIDALNSTSAIGFSRTSGNLPFPDTSIAEHGGTRMLKINDDVYPGIFGYVGWNWLPARRSIAEFSGQGRHIYEIVFQPWSLWKNGKLDAREFELKMNQMVNSIVAYDPQAQIFVRWWLYVPRDWGKYNPEGRITFDDGSHDVELAGNSWEHASYASTEWQEQYSAIVKEAMRRLKNSAYADRIFMVRVGYGNCGEWNNFGYHLKKFPGFSEQMRRKYILWLRSRYVDIAALNAAWNVTITDWQEIRVPLREERMSAEYGILRDPVKSGNYSDFYRFFSEYTVELINHFGQIVKDESDGKLLYGVFYGYFSHHLTTPPYHSLDSGHYAMGQLLESKVVDTICSPYNYGDRFNNIGLGMPLESIKAHGKLFLAEMDLPTHLAEAKNYADKKQHFCQSPEDSNIFYWRDQARVLTWGVGGYWYDFAHSWYTYKEFSGLVQKVSNANRLAAKSDNSSAAQVAVILDENSIFNLSLQSGDYGKILYQNLAFSFDRAGAPWDCWLASDINRVVAKSYKLLIFMNQFRQDKKINDALKNYQGSVLWVYGAGQLNSKELPPESRWSGVNVASDTKKTAGSLTLPGVKSPVVSSLVPGFRIKDDKINDLARFADGSCGFGRIPRSGGWNYYSALAETPPEFLAWIYDKTGVHRYCLDTSAYIYANRSFVAVWIPVASGDKITLTLPQVNREIIDAGTSEKISENTNVIEFFPEKNKPFIRFLFVR